MTSSILRAALIVTIPSIALYVGIIISTAILYPRIDRSSVVTAHADDSFISDPPAYLVHASTAFANTGPAMVFIGPSNVRLAFAPEIVQPHLPGITIHNASIGGDRIDGMAAIVRLFYAHREREFLDDVAFVFGLWHGEFLYRESNIEMSPVALQMKRFGLFEETEKGYRVVLPRVLFDLAVDMLRPFFWLQDALAPDGDILAWFRGEEPTSPDFILDRSCGASDLDALTREEQNPLRQIHPSQFEELVRVSKEVAERGGTLVLVDLPQPQCFTAASRRWREYQQVKLHYLEAAAAYGALYVDLQHLDDEANFQDWTHPTLAGANRMAAELSNALRRSGRLAIDFAQ